MSVTEEYDNVVTNEKSKLIYSHKTLPMAKSVDKNKCFSSMEIMHKP